MRDKAVFTINSNNRESGTPYNFSVKLHIEHSDKFDKVCVLSAVIPKTYYQVQANSNSFILNENGVYTTITISRGNYTRDSFAITLSNLLISNSPNHWTYLVLYPNTKVDPETALFTFQVSGNGGIQPQFILGSAGIHNQMGLQPNTTHSFSSNILMSNHTCNFASEPCVYLHSDICYNTISGDNILQDFFTSGVPYNSFINYSNLNPEVSAKSIVKHSQVYNFSLTDQNNVMLNTNGISCVFTIMLFSSTKFQHLIENFIKYYVNKNDTEELIEDKD